MVSAVIFDLDGTLTKTASPWRYIHERLGKWDNLASAYLDEWLAGNITYEEFCHRDTRLWHGCPLSEIEAFLDEIEQNRHVPAVARALGERRVPSIIISSGFRYVAARIQRQYGWAPLMIYANELMEGPKALIRVSGDCSGPMSKRAHAAAALNLVGVDSAATLVVSDSAADLEQLGDCGFRIHVREEDDLLKVFKHLE